MKNEELYKLLREFKYGKIGINKAKDEILLLFSVSGRSEQVCPCGKLIKRYRPTPCPTNGITYCEDCIGQTCH